MKEMKGSEGATKEKEEYFITFTVTLLYFFREYLNCSIKNNIYKVC